MPRCGLNEQVEVINNVTIMAHLFARCTCEMLLMEVSKEKGNVYCLIITVMLKVVMITFIQGKENCKEGKKRSSGLNLVFATAVSYAW